MFLTKPCLDCRAKGTFQSYSDSINKQELYKMFCVPTHCVLRPELDLNGYTIHLNNLYMYDFYKFYEIFILMKFIFNVVQKRT
jgi:hypothetical protein